MSHDERPRAETSPSEAEDTKKRLWPVEFKPSLQVGLPRKIDANRRTCRARPLWTGSKFLAALDALGVEWLGEYNLPCPTCGSPALSRPGVIICLGRCLERVRWAGVIDDFLTLESRFIRIRRSEP